jgi:hypothetical protein
LVISRDLFAALKIDPAKVAADNGKSSKANSQDTLRATFEDSQAGFITIENSELLTLHELYLLTKKPRAKRQGKESDYSTTILNLARKLNQYDEKLNENIDWRIINTTTEKLLNTRCKTLAAFYEQVETAVGKITKIKKEDKGDYIGRL